MDMTSKRSTEIKVLTIGQVAARSGVATSALRFYESRGLIKSVRNPSGQRRYSREILRRVAVIKTAQNLGITLSAIGKALSTLPENRVPTSADWQKLSTHWKGQLDRKITQLTLLRDQLDDCIGCGCLSLESCPLLNPDDIAAKEGSGAVLFEQIP